METRRIIDVAKINEVTITPSTAPQMIEYIDISSVDKGIIGHPVKIDFKSAPSRARRFVRDKDIIISTVRPNLRHYAYIKGPKENIIASTGFAVISCKEINPRYLYYYLTTNWVTEYLSAIADSHTSAYPAYNPNILEELEVPYPPLPTQERIADILGTLDDKIELNRKMNRTLEAMARAIFKSWFVDFDPVYAKMEVRDYPLPAEVMYLFPDELVESELGLIPKGWEVGTVGDIYEFAYGKSLPEKKRTPGEFPVYGSNGIVGTHNESLVEGPGIVIGRKGNPGIVTWAANDFFPIDTTFYIITNMPILFAFYQLDYLHLTRLSADSAVPGLNRNIAYLEEIPLPNNGI